MYLFVEQKAKLQNPNLRAALIAAADRESYAKKLMKDTFVAGKAHCHHLSTMALTNYGS